MARIDRRPIYPLALLVVLGIGPAARSAEYRLKTPIPLKADTPLLLPLPDAPAAGPYRLKLADGTTIPAQVVVEQDVAKLAVVLDRDLPGDAKFALEPAGPGPMGGVALTPSDAGVKVHLGGQLLTEYVANDGPKPYFFPVLGPKNRPFTRAFPMTDVAGEDTDHNHQRSFWFTHGNVDGVDFWASDPKNPPKANYGTIRETAREVLANGPVVGILRTSDDWLGPDGKTLCTDERIARFYNTGDARVIDVDVTIHAAADRPVTFRDTKEGMFGLRVASSMDVKLKQGGRITNAEGVRDNDAWGKASPWVDYTGPIDGETAGVAILNHPSSFRYPTTWHVRDYGLFAANPFGWKDFGQASPGDHTIPAGGSIVFRYRVVLHQGDTASARIADAFRAYAETAIDRAP